MRSVVGSSEEGPSNGQKLVIPGRDKAKKQMVSIPRLLHQREIRGQSTTMRSVRAWNRLCLMKMPHTLEINEHCYDLLRDAVFLGMSNDSSYVIGILYSSSSDRYIGADVEMVLIVMQLSPTQLIPAFVGDLHSKRMHEVFATFPQDSSFIAVLSFTEEIARHGLSGSDPMTTLIGIDFILFKFSIHLSMSTSIVLSSRWKKRLCRTLLRCFDKGAILNAGTTLVCILFTNYYSHNQTQTTTTPITTTTQRALRKSFQILEGEDNVDDHNEWSGVVLQEIHIVDAHPRSSPRCAKQYRLLQLSDQQSTIQNHGMKEKLIMTEVILDIEKLIMRITPIAVKCRLPGYCYVGIVDYEVDVINVIEETVFVMLTSIIEAKGPGASGTNQPFMVIADIKWNPYNGEVRSCSWRPFIAMNWKKAHQPNAWYPFSTKQTTNIEDRVISNEAFLSDESLKSITSPYAGIALYR